MDRILKSEGLSPNAYKAAKQADTLMLFFNFSENTVSALLSQLGYAAPESILSKNFAYYFKRTSHGSTLSRLVHAYLAYLSGDHGLSQELYQEALYSDFLDIQGGTTQEGIHLGVMTGTILFVVRAYAGLDWTGEILSLNPVLPSRWKQIEFNLSFRTCRYHFLITPQMIKLKTDSTETQKILIRNREISLQPQKWTDMYLNGQE
jgi:trehalose/maltose hydrolase-like predicted phosphorylase